MPPKARYLPTSNAPVIVSKEMEDYWDFYNTLQSQIENNGLEASYAQSYMNQKKTNREKALKSQNRPPRVSEEELDGYYTEGELAFRPNLDQQYESDSYRG